MTALPALIQCHQLANRLDDPALLIVDLCSDDQYRSAHIPGAVHITPRSLCAGTAPRPGDLPDKESLTRLLQDIGLSKDRQVVAYDDEGGGWAGRFIWTLDLLGFTGASYLDGGLLAWQAEDRPLTRDIPTVTPTRLDLAIVNPDIMVDKDDVLIMLGRKNVIVWDARSPQEYHGHKCLAVRNGHMPGAVNYEWTRAMELDEDRRLRNLSTIRQELAELGIDRDKTIITHCQTHHRSGLTYLLGKLLGFSDIRAYPGSWAEWGNSTDTPIES